MEDSDVRDYDSEERLRRIERERRRAKLRRIRRRRERQKKILLLGSMGICLVLIIAAATVFFGGKKEKKEETVQQPDRTEEMAGSISEGALKFKVVTEEITQSAASPKDEPGGDAAEADKSDGDMAEEDKPDSAAAQTKADSEEEPLLFAAGYTASATDSTRSIGGEDVLSTYALLIDLDDNTIVAQKNARDRMNPASMTKILTVLVAAEHITDLDDTFTITREITDYSYRNDCSAAGFLDGETVTVRDLFYGTVLPSGGDAAAGLAIYVAGSLEGFVDLMNQKISELGLSDTTHFTNCVGLYDTNHYCTAYDMAIMLKAAVENDWCREVLSAHKYTTSATEQHPEGIELSNWFLRRIEDKETNGEVVCAKTGYVAQSGSCAASYEVSNGGKHYICVTADTYSSWRCIYDHVAIYQKYTE